MIVKTTLPTPTAFLPAPHPRPEPGRHRFVPGVTPPEHRANKYVAAYKAAQR